MTVKKKPNVVRTKKYGKLIRFSVILASVILISGLAAYGWQNYEEEKYPEGTEKDYSLPNAFINFAKLINDFMTQKEEETPLVIDEPTENVDEEDNVIVVGSENTELPGEEVVEEEIPEVRGGIVPKTDSDGYYSFKDSLFVGDYFVAQAKELGYFEHSEFVTASGTGIDINTILTKGVLKHENEVLTLSEYVKTVENVEAVYVLFSAESISWMDCPTFVKKYTAFIDEIIAAQPEAHIYVQPIIPINEAKASKRGYSVTNEKISDINEYIYSIAEEKSLWILDNIDLFADESGALPEISTTNGIRLEKELYEPWAEYLLTHKAH